VDIEGRALKQIALAVLVVLLVRALVLAERAIGYVHHAARRVVRQQACPVIHMRGAHYGEIASSRAASSSSGHSGRSAGSGFHLILSARGLWTPGDGASHGSPTART